MSKSSPQFVQWHIALSSSTYQVPTYRPSTPHHEQVVHSIIWRSLVIGRFDILSPLVGRTRSVSRRTVELQSAGAVALEPRDYLKQGAKKSYLPSMMSTNGDCRMPNLISQSVCECFWPRRAYSLRARGNPPQVRLAQVRQSSSQNR